jgi:uncharacterized membrane protein
LLYYYFAWNLVGRGPKKGVIVPLCHPPEGFSPALTHFVHHMSWKKDGLTAFSAATISLATKGLLTIGKENNKISFTYQRGQRLKLKLPREESIVRNYFRSKDTLKANKSSGPKLNNTLGKFKKMIESENQDTYFSRNYKYVRISWFLSVLCVIGLSFFGAQVLASLVTMLLGWYVMDNLDFDSRWRGFRGGKGGWHLAEFLFFLCFFGLSFIANLFSGIATVATIFIMVVNLAFPFLMRAPTIQGRKIKDQIDGFKMYLESAETERLNFLHEPDFTVNRFEKFLPFAIALGVEKSWASRLEDEFLRNTLTESSGNYRLHWYHGQDLSSSSIANDISSMSSDIRSEMFAISAVESSSSSSGDSGSGGGGGGGW